MKVKFMQEGGAMPAPEAAPEQMGPQEIPQGGSQEDAQMQQLVAIAESIIQQLSPEVAGAVAEIILQMLQSGGSQPMPAPEEQPAFQRRGGRLQRIH